MKTLVTDEFDEPQDEFEAHFEWYKNFYRESQERLLRAAVRAGSFGGRRG